MYPKKFWNKIVKNNIPLEASFELTWRCNQKCLFCYQYSPQEDELSAKEIENIINQLANCGTLYITFTGGEPLLREDFWQIAKHTRERNFVMQLQTNGTLIDKSIAKKLKKLNFYMIIISLLGASSKTHDFLTGIEGSFEKVLKVVGYLKKVNLRVQLRTTITRENFHEQKNIEKLTDDLGIEACFSTIVLPRADGNKTPLKHRINDTQLKNYYNYTFSNKTKQCFSSRISKPAQPFLLCNFGRTCCMINARGEVNPCGIVSLNVGTLKEKTFREIWYGSDLLKNIRCATIKDLKECSNCDLIPFCLRCSGLAFLEKGDIFANSDESCRMARITKEVIVNEKSL